MPANYSSNKPRVPVPFEGIQVNFCKNMDCSHFGNEASTKAQKKGRGHHSGDGYVISNMERQRYRIKCKRCGQYSTLKSNKGIYEEIARISAYLDPDDKNLSCPDPDCPNHGKDVNAFKKLYQKNGWTSAKSRRYICKACEKSFSRNNRPTARQRIVYKNRAIFVSILNKVPFKRICETEGIGMQTIYDKIEFFHAQCLAFAAHRERQLAEKIVLERAYIASDRQDFIVNWTNTNDKRNVVLKAIASAEIKTGYVFGMNVNFDPSLDPAVVKELAEQEGDVKEDMAYRQFARVWLESDHGATCRARKHKEPILLGGLDLDIEERYKEALTRPEIEASDDPDTTMRLPYYGMQIHEEYTLYGHFFFLKRLLGNVGKVRFFLDQDSGIRAACLSAFKDEVMSATCDAFFVRINKDLNVHQKMKLCADYKRDMEEARERYPDLTDKSIRLLRIADEMERLKSIGRWDDRWLTYPFPDASEPEKAVCYLTNRNDYEEMHMAHLYHMASLHSIDSYFNQVRSRISCLQHSSMSQSNTGRRWYGNQPYNPAIVQKLLDMFRVYYNYCLKSKKDKLTPAMRIGLARAPIPAEDILNFTS